MHEILCPNLNQMLIATASGLNSSAEMVQLLLIWPQAARRSFKVTAVLLPKIFP